MKPFFISIPHSGERIPEETPWLHGLPEPIVMCDVDRFVNRLYAPIVSEMNITCVQTQWHRYVVDLNRLPEDVDAGSVVGSLNPVGKFSTGLHWVVTTRGDRLMPTPISEELHGQLVQRYFDPFHKDVRAAYAYFRDCGARDVYHLDAHSMPSKGTSAHRDPGQYRADVVVSDWEGRSASLAFKDLVVKGYQEAGLIVAYNWPYLGGRVTQTYGRPQDGQHAIQVELNRALYMNEESKQLVPERAAVLQAQISVAIRFIHQGLQAL